MDPIQNILDWFIKRVVGELPVIGPFVNGNDDYNKAKKKAVKCVFATAGMGLTMVAYGHTPEDATVKSLQMTLAMSAGKSVYNVGEDFLKCFSTYCARETQLNTDAADEEELQLNTISNSTGLATTNATAARPKVEFSV